MSDAGTWVPIAISGAALIVAIAGLVLGQRWRQADKKEVRDLRVQFDTERARVKVKKLIIKWQNSILSGEYAAADDNWAGLLARSKHWRDSLADELEELLEHTGGQQTRAYVLLQKTVDPAMRFETTVRPIVDRWEGQPFSQGKSEAKLEVEAAIRELQREFDKVISELEILSDDQLTKPLT